MMRFPPLTTETIALPVTKGPSNQDLKVMSTFRNPNNHAMDASSKSSQKEVQKLLKNKRNNISDIISSKKNVDQKSNFEQSYNNSDLESEVFKAFNLKKEIKHRKFNIKRKNSGLIHNNLNKTARMVKHVVIARA